MFWLKYMEVLEDLYNTLPMFELKQKYNMQTFQGQIHATRGTYTLGRQYILVNQLLGLDILHMEVVYKGCPTKS